MAEDTQKSETEEAPIFQTGMGAFDRAGLAETDTKGLIDGGDRGKTAEEVKAEAQKYYNSKYEESIKKIDPAYDPTSIESKISELTYGSNIGEINKYIDEGKTLEGVKDILPLAKAAAENRVELTKSLKTGTTTQIAEKVGIKNIKEMSAFDEVSKVFSDATFRNVTLEKSLSNLSEILSLFNSEIKDANVTAKMLTPQNNATISALARILEKEGFSSEMVKSMSKRFEDDLSRFSGKKINKIEGLTALTQLKAETSANGATATTESQKIENKSRTTGIEQNAGEKNTAEKSKEAVSFLSSVLGESVIGKITTPEEKSSIVATATSEPQKIENKLETTRTEEKSEEKNTAEKSKEAVSFLSSVLGESVIGKKTTAEEAIFGKKKSESITSSTGLESAKLSNEKIQSASSSKVLNDKSSASMISNAEGALQEKTAKKAETISSASAIKETSSQKLSSISTPTPTAEIKTEELATAAEKNTNPIESGEKKVEEAKVEKTLAIKEEEKGTLENKMQMMIALLSQMNETLQGPLLTINSSKKYE